MKNINSSNRLNNYSGGRISFDTKNKNLSSKGSQILSHHFHPRENQGEIIDESIEAGNSLNQKHFVKNQASHYYHNAKALENVLKEDKEAHLKREIEREQLIKRKEKVASYSKLVKEIHWESNADKRKEILDYIPKKRSVNKDTNKTFEEKRKSKMMAINRIKEYRRKQTGDQKSVQEPSELNENFEYKYKNDSRTSK